MNSPLEEKRILFLDNHLIAVRKLSGEPVQPDSSGDLCLADRVKAWIKQKFDKPGEVYLGVVHRLDRPVSGIVVFARTSKAAARLSEQFRDRTVVKKYRALVPLWNGQSKVELEHWLVKDASTNKARIVGPKHPQAKRALMRVEVLRHGKSLSLVEIELETGRHHQIRAQLAAVNAPIRGDLKYGSERSVPGGGIDLCSVFLSFDHPVGQQRIELSIDPEFGIRL